LVRHCDYRRSRTDFQGSSRDPAIDASSIARDTRHPPGLGGYFHAFVKTADDAASLVSRLKEDPDITYADAQQRWQRPVRFGRSDRTLILRQAFSVPLPGTPNLVPEQAYLAAAPGGVDALHAWTRPGGQGDSVKVVDVESGWNFSHEDLRANENGVIFGPSEDEDHGTAVLGICSGDVNTFGVTGISPGAFVGGASANYDFTVPSGMRRTPSGSGCG
jgi:hypothetical protein